MKGVHQYPIHLLNKPYTRLWYSQDSSTIIPWNKRDYRREIAKEILERYPSGAAVAGCMLNVIALIQKGGQIEIYKPPYKIVHMHQVANKPLVTECQCFGWFEPNKCIVWKDTPEAHRGIHHPVCQFLRESKDNFQKMKTDRINRR